MGAFNWLAYGISHGFYPNYVPSVGDTPHYAVDIATPYHTPITALFSGTVVEQKTGLPWGTEVFIKPDTSGLPTYYYYHLDQLNTTVGQHVNAGDVIGLSGGQNTGGANPSDTANSSGPHTHVGFWTSWTSTPIGTRPYGPDITPYVNALAKGSTIPQGNLNPSGEQASPNSSSSSGANLPGFGQKAGLFVAALLLVGFGAYLVFKKQADEALHKGIDATKKAVEIGAVA